MKWRKNSFSTCYVTRSVNQMMMKKRERKNNSSRRIKLCWWWEKFSYFSLGIFSLSMCKTFVCCLFSFNSSLAILSSTMLSSRQQQYLYTLLPTCDFIILNTEIFSTSETRKKFSFLPFLSLALLDVLFDVAACFSRFFILNKRETGSVVLRTRLCWFGFFVNSRSSPPL